MRKPVSGYNGGMGFFQIDPNIERMLPADIRLLNLHAEPYANGKRVKVSLDITPFQQKPYLDLSLTDSTGKVLATTSIVEPVSWNLELNLHIRNSSTSPSGECKLSVVLSYPDLGEVDRRVLKFEIPSAAE
ncbi:MAG: hypothetical protein ACXWNC_05460 [Anaerolineales bacterium]